MSLDLYDSLLNLRDYLEGLLRVIEDILTKHQHILPTIKDVEGILKDMVTEPKDDRDDECVKERVRLAKETIADDGERDAAQFGMIGKETEVAASEDALVTIPLPAWWWASMVVWGATPSCYIEGQLRQKGYGELLDRYADAEQRSRRVDLGPRS